MSIMAMADAQLVSQVRATDPKPPPAPVGVPANIVNQLVQWIPTETITLYVAYVSLFDPVKAAAGTKLCAKDFTPRWVGFWVFVALTALIALGGYYGKRRATRPMPPFKWPLFAMFVAPLAFAAWAAALPDTPFADICGYKATFGGFAVLVASVGIAFVAWMVGKNPDYMKS